MSDDGTLGPARRRDNLRMAVDFGTVCRRCGARLLDEPETIVVLTMRRRAVVGVADTTAWQERVLVVCDDCAPKVWAPLEERFWAVMAREKAPAKAAG